MKTLDKINFLKDAKQRMIDLERDRALVLDNIDGLNSKKKILSDRLDAVNRMLNMYSMMSIYKADQKIKINKYKVKRIKEKYGIGYYNSYTSDFCRKVDGVQAYVAVGLFVICVISAFVLMPLMAIFNLFPSLLISAAVPLCLTSVISGALFCNVEFAEKPILFKILKCLAMVKLGFLTVSNEVTKKISLKNDGDKNTSEFESLILEKQYLKYNISLLDDKICEEEKKKDECDGELASYDGMFSFKKCVSKVSKKSSKVKRKLMR